MKKIYIFIIISILVVSCVAVAYIKNICFGNQDSKKLVPKVNHPRVLVNNKDIQVLRDKVNTEELSDAWQRLQSNCELYKYESSYDSIRKSFESNAFVYLIYGSRNNGKLAVRLAKNILNKENFKEKKGIDAYNKSNDAGRIMLGGAMVYDWCYPLLSRSDKHQFIKGFKQMAKYLECGYPPSDGSALTGHLGEAMLMRDMMAAGIASYDEDKEMYNLASKRFFKKYVPARVFAYKSGMHYQGSSYGPFRYAHEMFATWLFDKMGYPKIFGNEQSKIPYSLIYSRRPDGQLFRDGDDFLSTGWYNIGQYWELPQQMLFTYGYFKDSYIKYEFLKEKQYTKKYNHDLIDPLFEILFSDVKVKPKKPDSLPLTRYFGSPIGEMISRTGWGEGMNSSTAVTEMKIGEYAFNNHAHLDAGSFQIYYKGPLAIDSGVYDKYGSSHDINYQKRTIAHNSMLVYDSKEVFKYYNQKLVNDGGQKWPNQASEPKDLGDLLKNYKRAKVMNYSFGPNVIKPFYSYLKGDLTLAYSSNKLSQMNRSFVSLNLGNKMFPTALIVFDRVVSKKPNNNKYWLLHCIQEPMLSQGTAIIKRNTNGYNGRLILKTLLPAKENLVLKKVGGQGHEFDVFGKDIVCKGKKCKTSSEAGAWRVEVSPKKVAKEDEFLNVMVTSDANRNNIPDVSRVDSKTMIGTKVLNNVVMFSKSGVRLNKNITFNISGKDKQIRYLVTDLSAGQWKISLNNRIINSKALVKSLDGMIYFTGVSGTVKIKYLGK